MYLITKWSPSGAYSGGGAVGGAPPLDAITFAKKVEIGKKKLANSGSATPP